MEYFNIICGIFTTAATGGMKIEASAPARILTSTGLARTSIGIY